MDLFDTHFHLPESGSLDDFPARLLPEHSYRMLALGASLAGSIRACEYASGQDNVWFACGVHPHDAENFDGDLEPFKNMLANPKNCAVGEIGLDFFYDFAPRRKQIKCFEQFLQLAAEYHKPVSVHCRDQADSIAAYEDCYAMLKNFMCNHDHKAVLHCYAGNGDFLEKFLELGCYIGVTGMVTFPKSDNIRQHLKNIPRDRLLFETDSPYLAPVPFRGKENHPALVATVVQYAANFLDLDPETLAAETTANALKFLDLEAQA